MPDPNAMRNLLSAQKFAFSPNKYARARKEFVFFFESKFFVGGDLFNNVRRMGKKVKVSGGGGGGEGWGRRWGGEGKGGGVQVSGAVGPSPPLRYNF